MSGDPTGAEDIVVDGEDPEGGDSNETDPQLLLYRSLRQETRARISQHQRSLLSGLSVIGVVIAYALLSGEFVFLAVIPLVVGFLVVQTAQYLNNLFYITRHLSRIERAYTDEYPLFEWENRYGVAGTDRALVQRGVDWSIVPQYIVLVLGLLGYLGSVYAAYVVWPPRGIEILVIGLSRDGLLAGYVLLTALVCLAGFSFYLHRAELNTAES